MMRVRGLVNRLSMLVMAGLVSLGVNAPVHAEDGYDLWLRYAPLEGEALARLQGVKPQAHVPQLDDPTVRIAYTELLNGVQQMRGHAGEDWLVLGQPRNPNADHAAPHGFALYCNDNAIATGGAFTVNSGDDAPITIRASEPIGCLYGAYATLRELAQGRDPRAIDLNETPAMPLRMLNHWDNPDGHVERGYAGRSIFDWWHLPQRLDDRMIDYARANASIGINGVVVNNVNARAFMLEPRYIAKLARLADAWRPYGIRVFLSARFSAPRDIGGLDTADPLDPAVAAWWKAKADEIYARIPDFGGYLVKANSEGQPGPQDYGRTHADGANMMANALGDRGTVIWRAFVYSAEDDTDRAAQAYAEFVPLDGQFADNVIVQVKNGPIDFQPREPFHPMFGAMPRTRLMLEAQITREYLGQASGIVYLPPMWLEVLAADTGSPQGTVAQVIAPVGIAGVANTGSDRNWTGAHFDQANWYAFGRMAWNPAVGSEAIAREWAAQTFTADPRFVDQITPVMMASREAVVDYMTPMGLAHQMATGHHYGPGPWVCDLARPEWNPCYYHRADKGGIGFDRTASGSGALSQYRPAIRTQWSDPATTDPQLLLWFHHVAWNAPMAGGGTVWENLLRHYDRGVATVDDAARKWSALGDFVDPQRHRAVAERLAIQQEEARWWRDASIAYWQSINGLPLPVGAAEPAQALDQYQSREFPEAPGQ